MIPTNSVYEKQDRNASPSGNEADASVAHSLDENHVMDTSKSKGVNDHVEEEEKEPKLTYDAEEYEDENKHEEEEVEEEKEEGERDSSNIDNSATKKERSPAETSSISNTEARDNSRDEDYLEDPPTNQYDNTYYYYDEYENGNHSRYEPAGEFK